MASRASDDPQETGVDDGLPVVANRSKGNAGLYVFIVAVLVGGVWLFTVMSANRTAIEDATELQNAGDAGPITSPAPLALPREWGNAPSYGDRPYLGPAPSRFVDALPPPRNVAPTIVSSPTSRPADDAQAFMPSSQPYVSEPVRPLNPPQSVVFDRAFASDSTPTNSNATDNASPRVMAGRLAHPSLTVPQGTVIQAVLETALDSTRPGGARALVQRDVKGFDGTRILIQRGSRLYGEYGADLQAGQKRAAIRWTRLIRPDGVTIALDSPASDPLGRAGVKGDVDSHFFQRFGGAILQSVLDIGVGIATSRATNGVIYALPGSTQNVQVQDGNTVKPTLKVKQGTSLTVFVARDLDFSNVEF